MTFLIISCSIFVPIFCPIYTATEIIIPYGIHPFDICYDNPSLWNIIKITYIFTFIFSNLIISNFIYARVILNIESFFKTFKQNLKNKEDLPIPIIYNKNSLNLLIGLDKESNSKVFIPESGLYQNFLITGTIRLW